MRRPPPPVRPYAVRASDAWARAFARGHAAEFELLTAEAGPELDRLMVVPPDLNPEAEPVGGYRTAVGRVVDGPGRIAHADPARALLDEIGRPRHGRVQLAASP
ncbi:MULTISPECIES: hypothetical protein [unclassified Streptomyces]|uniref:hypothetical protein n=1 Tax=unclassified Streptomyces TaxID=2593676 RepID=UPI000B0F38D9|nr:MULTISPECIES: hypothetical protein [unclassified Streptomyces]